MSLKKKAKKPKDDAPVKMKKGKKDSPKKKLKKGASDQKVRKKKKEKKAPDTPLGRAVERWKSGESFGDLAKELGMARSAFRRELTAAVGGKTKFRELREAGAGGSKAAFGGKRGGGRRRKQGEEGTVSFIDDRGVPVIGRTKTEDGWKSRVLYVNVGGAPLKDADSYLPFVSESVFTSPEGEEYVIARPNEKADLIVKGTTKGLGDIRLRLLSTSSIGKKAKAQEKLAERGQEKHEKVKAAKREKRQKRMKRKVG